jgi:hypothetical protein
LFWKLYLGFGKYLSFINSLSIGEINAIEKTDNKIKKTSPLFIR